MSACYLLLSSVNPRIQRSFPTLREAAARWCPFVPEGMQQFVSRDGATALYTWSIVPEAARGAWACDEYGMALAYTGAVDEDPNVPLCHSVARGLLGRVWREGMGQMAATMDGDWSAAVLRADGVAEVGCDALGGAHIYHGSRAGLVAVSNRAMMVATALHDGALPTPDPRALSLLHTCFSAMLGTRTCWPDVEILAAGHTLTVRPGVAALTRLPDGGVAPEPSWRSAFERLVARVSMLRRLPDLKFRMTLTGGKDSRLILAALVAGGGLDRVSEAYLEGPETLPDVVVGKRLAKQFGLRWTQDRAPLETHGSLHDSLMIHNVQAEVALNAWDRKGAHTKPRMGDIRGYYGEIYKNQDMAPLSAGGWPVFSSIARSRPYLDPHRVLTAQARRGLRDQSLGWLADYRRDGGSPWRVRTAHHRDARVRRWFGQAQQSDAHGAMALNPLPSSALLLRHDGLSFADRSSNRTHFELLRAFDDVLWREAFADFRWPARLTRPLGRRSAQRTGGDDFGVRHQATEWRNGQHDIAAELLDPYGAEAFFEVYDRQGLKRLLARTARNPSHRPLKAVLAALAIRHAVTRPLEPRPFQVEPAARNPAEVAIERQREPARQPFIFGAP